MKITKIDIPKTTETNDGLEDIKMDRLSKVVLIAGKNGSGKTRILNKIFNTLSSKPKASRLVISVQEIKDYNSNIQTYKQSITQFENQLTAAVGNSISEIENNILNYKRNVESWENNLKNCLYEQNWSFIETDLQSDNYSFVKFVPKKLELQDCNAYSKSQIISDASTVDSVGIENLPRGTFAKIQVIQDRWFNSTHQHSQATEEEKLKAIFEYEKLQSIIDVFLSTKITRTINDEATLFGFPMGQSNLSDGQKILLQFCLALYSQDAALKDLILVLDEPENHLHPSVIIETIEMILSCVTDGQIWIATHSVPLLSHFDPSQLWFVEKGKISYAGRIPEKVLESLLGDESEIAKLLDFISLPSQFATSRYSYESLLEPSVVMTNSNDSQTIQIRTDLLTLSANGKLRILDYGVGKGRLIANISELDLTNKTTLIESIDYIGFDKYNNDKEICETSLAKAYGNAEKRYYNDFNVLFSHYDKESFDIVIMCNVLHEIDPIEWLKLFQPNGIISSCLKENGILLLIEDQQIPTGEKAYQKGFLVLDTPQLKELFQITETDTNFSFTDKNNDGRLKAHQIPKNILTRISEATRLKAIQSMSLTSRDKILEIREMEKNYKNGKLHGFWTQQFANAQLNLAELTTQ
ncbi:MAG: AAA family ATPase [Bacteroidota bacterium]|jgi:ABC-type cobalamin/Fe3+-siderophores transport system ATPase subunit